MHALADQIVEAARRRVDCRYRHLGRGPHYDCVGLLFDVAHELGLTEYETGDYSRRPNAEEFTRHMREAGCTRIPVEELAHGDIMRMAYDRWPVHTGILAVKPDGRYLIHAFLPYKRVVEEKVTLDMWSKLNAAWRFPQ